MVFDSDHNSLINRDKLQFLQICTNACSSQNMQNLCILNITSHIHINAAIKIISDKKKCTPTHTLWQPHSGMAWHELQQLILNSTNDFLDYIFYVNHSHWNINDLFVNHKYRTLSNYLISLTVVALHLEVISQTGTNASLLPRSLMCIPGNLNFTSLILTGNFCSISPRPRAFFLSVVSSSSVNFQIKAKNKKKTLAFVTIISVSCKYSKVLQQIKVHAENPTNPP